MILSIHSFIIIYIYPQAHTVEVRLRVGDLIIYTENFIIPAQPRPSVTPSPVPEITEETSMIVGESWLTYGVGISVLLLTILLAILLILILKHIQAKRRETDKGMYVHVLTSACTCTIMYLCLYMTTCMNVYMYVCIYMYM